MMTLYQFQFSHFCEKARWALDFKGLPYACKNLITGPHRKVASNLAPRSCLPILVDGGVVVYDSTVAPAPAELHGVRVFPVPFTAIANSLGRL